LTLIAYPGGARSARGLTEALRRFAFAEHACPATLDVVKTFNLRQVRLRSGEQHRDTVEVDLEPYDLGGERYLPVPERPEAELVITQAATGTVFELRFTARLHGPCQRCLIDAVVDLPIGAREYEATSPGGAEELRSPYVREGRLDLAGWARDAIALELPEQVLCRPDCAGLCPVCGKDLNVEPHEHEEEHGDPRWAVLEGLREKL
jgi:uncharacterized protein